MVARFFGSWTAREAFSWSHGQRLPDPPPPAHFFVPRNRGNSPGSALAGFPDRNAEHAAVGAGPFHVPSDECTAACDEVNASSASFFPSDSRRICTTAGRASPVGVRWARYPDPAQTASMDHTTSYPQKGRF